jgi:hypothetical protein
LYLNTGSCLRQFGSWKWSCTHDAYMYPVKGIFETVKLTLATTQIQHIYYYSSAGWKQLWNGLRIEKKLEAQWAEHVSLTFHSVLRKLNTEPSIGAPIKLRFSWLSSISEGRFLKIYQLETRISYGSHVCLKQMGRKLAICIEDLP